MKRVIFLLSIAVLGLPDGTSGISAKAGETRTVHPEMAPLLPKELTEGAKQRLAGEALDRLFGRLHRTKSAKRAKFLTRSIWKIWGHSSSPTANLLLLQAQRAMAAGQERIAIAILSSVIEQYPKFTEALNKRATAYYIAGEYDRSLADIKEVLDREPRHFGALSGLGLIYQRRGKKKKALDAFRRALAINPYLKDAKRAVKRLSGKVEQDI